jgi:uncharacterized membrane protein
LAMLRKDVLLKLLVYKAGALGLTIMVAYALTEQWRLAGKVGLACELATVIYYYCFECVWRKT